MMKQAGGMHELGHSIRVSERSKLLSPRSLLSGLIFAACLLPSSAIADESEAEKLSSQVRQVTNQGFHVKGLQDAVTWHSAGSVWTVTDKKEAPDDFAKSVDRFTWRGGSVVFDTPTCAENKYGAINMVYQGRIDMASVDFGRRADLTLEREQRNFPKIECQKLGDDWARRRVVASMDLKAFKYQSVNMYYSNGKDRGFDMQYDRVTDLDALVKTNWRPNFTDGVTGGTCQNLSFTPAGAGGMGCCNNIFFNAENNEGIYKPKADVNFTLKGCSGNDSMVADDQLTSFIIGGFEVGDDGRLVGADGNESKVTFDPVSRLEAAQGTWRLEALTARTLSDVMPSLPRERGTTMPKAMRKLKVNLVVGPDTLTLKSPCRSREGSIAAHKPGFVQIGDIQNRFEGTCPDRAGSLEMINRSFGQILDEKAAVHVDFDATAEKLTLTRQESGRRSVSWTFGKP